MANPEHVPLRVVADADLSIPPALTERLNIIAAPADAAPLIERENIPRLALEAGAPLDAGPVVEGCRRAGDGGGGVLYVSPGDGPMGAWGRPEGVEAPAREAVERSGGRFLSLAADLLMAAGWRAVLAAEASAAGATPEDAYRVASEAQTRLLALVEHPELAGDAMPGNPDTTNRIVTFVRDEGFSLDSMPHRREDGLRRLRDRFASAVEGLDGLRVVVHHGGAAPAAEAMATWIGRHVSPREVHVSPITRHAGTRLGPGFVGIAWTFEG